MTCLCGKEMQELGTNGAGFLYWCFGCGRVYVNPHPRGPHNPFKPHWLQPDAANGRVPKVHFLKTWPEWFELVVCGIKKFEVRQNDKNYQVGDFLELQEWDPIRSDPDCEVHNRLMPDGTCTCFSKGTYTGRSVRVRIDYRTDHMQKNGNVVMSISLLKKD